MRWPWLGPRRVRRESRGIQTRIFHSFRQHVHPANRWALSFSVPRFLAPQCPWCKRSHLPEAAGPCMRWPPLWLRSLMLHSFPLLTCPGPHRLLSVPRTLLPSQGFPTACSLPLPCNSLTHPWGCSLNVPFPWELPWSEGPPTSTSFDPSVRSLFPFWHCHSSHTY